MARVNSASVVGVSPEAVHLREVPHLPVWQVPLPFLSKLQPVRAQIRPDHATGAVSTMDWCDFNSKPPPLKFSPGKIAGQIVSLQSFMRVKILADSHTFAPAHPVYEKTHGSTLLVKLIVNLLCLCIFDNSMFC